MMTRPCYIINFNLEEVDIDSNVVEIDGEELSQTRSVIIILS